METKLLEGVKFTWDNKADTFTAFSCIGMDFALQLDAYRAKKEILQTLSVYFLLSDGLDFFIVIKQTTEKLPWTLFVSFTSSCGRYAFWRLLNNKAPEAFKRLAGNG